MNTFMQSRLNQMLATAALIALIIALGAYAYMALKSTDQWGGPTTINVTGEGEVMMTPDVATFSFTIRGEGADATVVTTALSDSMTKVKNYLTAQGVEEKDIKTESYTVSPRFSFPPTPPCFGMNCPVVEPVQNGFEGFQSVTVKVRDTAKAGTILSGVSGEGASDVSGLSFTIDDTDAAKAEARELAIADAQEKAQALADQLGVRLGDMMGFFEEGPYNPMPYYGMGGDMAMSAKAESAPGAVVPMGENTISSRVTLTYKIK